MTEQSASLSKLGLGCSRTGSFNNPQPLAESRALIAAAVEMGVTVIDTSNIYGQGDSEVEIGRALAGTRDKAFIVTKTGRGFSAKMRLLRPLKPLLRPLLAARKRSGGGTPQAAATPAPQNSVTARREQELRMDWRPESFASSLEGSLRRLRTDRVDGFLLHSPDAAVAGDPAVGAALAALKSAGKVVHFGVSCDDRACLDAAMTMQGLSLLQLPWDVIAAMEPTMVEAICSRGILVLAREIIRMQPGVPVIEAVQRSVDHPAVASTLVGTTSRKHLQALAEGIQ